MLSSEFFEELRVHRVVSAKLRQHESKNHVSELDQEGARAFKLKRAGKSTRIARGLLCATFVLSATLWLEMLPKIPPQSHREHKGYTEVSIAHVILWPFALSAELL